MLVLQALLPINSCSMISGRLIRPDKGAFDLNSVFAALIYFHMLDMSKTPSLVDK